MLKSWLSDITDRTLELSLRCKGHKKSVSYEVQLTDDQEPAEKVLEKYECVRK
jgi:hypothetical protein